MPQAESRLQALFMTETCPDGIQAAETVVRAAGIKLERGIIYAVNLFVSSEVEDAIQFLVREWDYGLESIQVGKLTDARQDAVDATALLSEAAAEEQQERRRVPRRFRVLLPVGDKHPNGQVAKYRYGCYFPQTDLVIHDMGGRGTGLPQQAGIEWLDL